MKKTFKIKKGDPVEEMHNYIYDVVDAYDHKSRKNINVIIEGIEDDAD